MKSGFETSRSWNRPESEITFLDRRHYNRWPSSRNYLPDRTRSGDGKIKASRHDSNDSTVLMDRDTKVSEAFRSILEPSGVQTVRLPPRSPNLSPHLERFMRSVKEECLERMIFLTRISHHLTPPEGRRPTRLVGRVSSPGGFPT
jgi:hypothetical protein